MTRRNRMTQYFEEVEADAAIADEPDVRVVRRGPLYLVEPLSGAARRWVEENVELEGWQWVGGRFAVHPSFIERLVDGMRQDGLAVEDQP